MKKIAVAFSVFMLLLGLSGAAGAYVITYNYGTSGNEFISPYAGLPGFVTEDFNSAPGSTLWTWTGNGGFITGSGSTGAAPAGVGGVADATRYVAVPADTTPADRTFTATNLGGTYNYLGLWWGSVDWRFNNIFNEIRFYNGVNLVATVTGFDVGQPDANGNWYLPNTNLYVNINNLPFFDSFAMYSNTYAFEADNITVGVPEPTTLLMLGFGLLGLAGIRRKR